MRQLNRIRETVEQASTAYEGGQPLQALALLDGIRFDPESRRDAAYGRFLCVRGSALAETGQIAEATASFRKALKFYASRGEESAMGLVYFNLGNVHNYASQYERANESYRMALGCFKPPRDAGMASLVWLSLGNMHAGNGEWEAARECLIETNILVVDDHDLNPDLLWSKRSLETSLAVIDGNADFAVERARQALDAAKRSRAPTYEAESLVTLAELLARRAETEEARAAVKRARELLKGLEENRADELRRKAQSHLVKINNLDMAFGAPAYSGSDSAPAQAAEPEIAPTATDTDAQDPERGRRIGANAPLSFVEGLTDKQSFLEKVDEISRSQNVGHLCVFSGTNGFVCPLDRAVSVVLDVDDPSTWERLAQEWASSPAASQALERIAAELNGFGVRLRAQGLLGPALLHQTFALRAALHLGLLEGICAIAGNLVVLQGQINRLKYARTEGNQGAVLMAGGDTLFAGRSTDVKGEGDRMLQFMRTETANALASLRNRSVSSESPQAKTCRLRSLRRLATLSGHSNAEWLIESCRLFEQQRDSATALIDIYEELAAVDLVDVFSYLGRIAHTYASGERLESHHFESVWELYLRWRTRVASIDSPKVPSAAGLAMDRLEVLRSHAVAGGGSFGHRASYDIAQFLGRVNRDVIRQMIAGGAESQLQALALAEMTCSRALVDWMGRTHPNNRLTTRKGIQGSIGEVACASLDEIFTCAAETGTTILYYVAVVDGYALWIIQPDGHWDCVRIEGIAADLRKLFDVLPYTFKAPDLAHLRLDAMTQAERNRKMPPDGILLQLGGKLLPDRIREKLDGAERKRIAIVADQMMQFVPFACLRWDESTYLIDKFDFMYWPSTTAWLLCAQGEAALAGDSSSPSESIVLGGPDFSTQLSVVLCGVRQSIALEDLPGARAEAAKVANILGVAEPLTLSQASLTTLMRRYSARTADGQRRHSIPVLHLATHGMTDPWDPDQSFIAFADSVLTAGSLYEYDPGLPTRLVTLSCCQTAIGYAHPDSILSLANAFLVAGACTVASTLWNVDDDTGPMLMSCFYERLRDTRTEDAAAAISAAQLQLRSDPQWSHPLYWAPFRVSGSCSNPLWS